MKALIQIRGVAPLLAVQSQVAFNDNVSKLALVGLVQMVLPPGEAGLWVGAIALLLVVPFVVFAPLAGWLADRYSKRAVLEGSLWLQLGVMVALGGALAAGSLALAVGGFFLLGLQSALMSPARRGILKELAPERVGQAVGWMDMLCIAAILAGGLAGGVAVDASARAAGSPWTGALWVIGGLGVLCAVALVVFRYVPRGERAGAGARRFGWGEMFGHFALIGRLRGDRVLWRAALGDAVFYFAGGILTLTLSQAGRFLHPTGQGAAGATGVFLAVVGAGVAVGSAVAAQICRREPVMALVPVGGLIVAVAAAVAAACEAGSAEFAVALGAMGLGSGIFMVPLGALLVVGSREEERGRILAGSSMLSSVAGVLAVGAHWVLSAGFGMGIGGQLAVLGGIFAAVAVAACALVRRDVLRALALAIARTRYGVTALGAGRFPREGGVLVVCNHVSYVDTIILSLACPRPIRFLSYEGFFRTPVLGWILRTFRAIPVSSDKAKDAIRAAAGCLEAGEVVCIFPEGQLTRTGQLLEIKGGYELIARRAGCPVVAAWLDGLWGSVHSFEGGRYFTKWPRGIRRKVRVAFSAPMTPVKPAVLREVFAGLSVTAFEVRQSGTIGGALVQGLSTVDVCILESTGKSLRGIELLGLASGLAVRFRKLGGKRVGVILPPGIGSAAANLGLIFAGKVPVNLNPAMPGARECLERAGIHALLSDARIRRKYPSFPWPDGTLDLAGEAASIGKVSILLRGVVAALAPQVALARAFVGVGADDEAALLFTSGTSGLPEGVPLTHRNLLTNIEQVSGTGFFLQGDRVLSPLPLFHSFGLTMGLLLPLAKRVPLLTAPNPLDHDAVAAVGRAGRPTILLATPTFLRGYLRGVPRDAFGALRAGVAGAERLAGDVRVAFRERFGAPVIEGYGLTEASPVVCIGMADPATGHCAESHQSGSREGSVGRLLPGIAFRFHDAETGLHAPGATSGLLALRGPNIVGGYLGNSRPDKFRDGWFVTGDVAAIDADGFVTICGRLARFSKIGGEMVSHAAVEEAIAGGLGGCGQDCIVGRPSERKGEELVLITTRAIDRAGMRAALAGKVPPLWMPAGVLGVDKIPVLGTGKTDLQACLRLAMSDGFSPEPYAATVGASCQ